ncbi:Arm DNA-binding domain-containing protein [Enterobacter kobei]|uniref:Arm DNA-binding domain-containing protein n=1 Tax=Enterobacter kobei TaxID=208224 RepID=UPI0015A75051|nr:site-specific integrase [Enterobacter kobei]MCK7294022.1 site-specific integrase [Enterobacter kobei]MDA4734656.1 site-specific integrase [Enterobacter kobei]MDA4824428.1 site-specific integrase [Enterobacter kobei]MEA3827868.1 site-specific integrase [Enterobacter kobei]MEA4245951.1 site-specific integrase [Enterobacter kobei]
MNFPTGVELHNGKIRITFTYRGIRCREVLRGWVVNSSNIKKAGNLRAVIVSEIQFGQFDYAARFPESKALKKFSSTKRIGTFNDLCEFFIDTKALEVSEATLHSIVSVVNTLKRVVGENTRLVDIQHADVLNYRKELLTGEVVNPSMPNRSKKGRAPSTVNKQMAVLSEMLKLANRSQFILHAPYEGVSRLKLSKAYPDPLLLHEYHALIALLPRKWVLIIIVSVHTGMRPGEVCALAWEDIDLKKGEIHVSRNLTNKGLFVPPKTDAGIRTITLLKPALDALKEQYEITGNSPRQQIIFHHRELGKTETQNLRFVFSPERCTSGKNRYFSKNSISYGWNRGTKLSGIRERNPYQSRHTYACWTLMAGANPSFIASQMGHEDARMVYEVYSKWIGDMNQDQVNMLNNQMPTAMPPRRPQGIGSIKKVI